MKIVCLIFLYLFSYYFRFEWSKFDHNVQSNFKDWDLFVWSDWVIPMLMHVQWKTKVFTQLGYKVYMCKYALQFFSSWTSFQGLRSLTPNFGLNQLWPTRSAHRICKWKVKNSLLTFSIHCNIFFLPFLSLPFFFTSSTTKKLYPEIKKDWYLNKLFDESPRMYQMCTCIKVIVESTFNLKYYPLEIERWINTSLLQDKWITVPGRT